MLEFMLSHTKQILSTPLIVRKKINLIIGGGGNIVRDQLRTLCPLYLHGT